MHCSLERLKKEPELLQADQDQLNRQAQVTLPGCSLEAWDLHHRHKHVHAAHAALVCCDSQAGHAQHATVKRSFAEVDGCKSASCSTCRSGLC